uniref:Transmembrane protein n=1 Tax=Arundo donax TaxID=35708 RepID=A0A0A9DL76_ARUDO
MSMCSMGGLQASQRWSMGSLRRPRYGARQAPFAWVPCYLEFVFRVVLSFVCGTPVRLRTCFCFWCVSACICVFFLPFRVYVVLGFIPS